jgi:hypothetical protein
MVAVVYGRNSINAVGQTGVCEAAGGGAKMRKKASSELCDRVVWEQTAAAGKSPGCGDVLYRKGNREAAAADPRRDPQAHNVRTTCHPHIHAPVYITMVT